MILATLVILAATLGDYTIVRPKEISAADETVLRDFGSLLAKSLGSELKTATEGDAPDANRIFFGIAPSGTEVSALGAQDLVTSVDAKGDVYLYGGGTNGTRNAAYDWLMTISPNCYVELNTYHFRSYLNAAYEEGSFNKVRIYASLKFEGPAFYEGDTRPNRVLCDRVVVVRE